MLIIMAFQKQKSLWLNFSPPFGKDSDEEVATEQLTQELTAKVDVTFMPHENILIVWMFTRSINRRQTKLIKGNCLLHWLQTKIKITVLYLLTTVLYFPYSTLDILWNI